MVRSASFLDLGDLAAEPGSAAWVRAVYVEAVTCLRDITKGREYCETWIGALARDNNFRKLAYPDRDPFVLWEDFCVAPEPYGLGYDAEAVRKLIDGRPTAEQVDARDRANKAQSRPGERTDLGNNVPKVGRPEGNAPAKALRRLRKDRPDLHARVLAGELSPHAAAIQAGFRPRTITLLLDVERAATTLRRHLSAADRARLAALLMDGDP